MRRVILEPGEVFSNKHLKRTGAFNAAALTAATAIIEDVVQTDAEPAFQFMSPGYVVNGEDFNDALGDYGLSAEADPEAAQAALAEAGYPNGEGFPAVTLSYYTNETVKKVVERTFELMGRRRPGKAIVFIIDEVGQHVARSGDKIEDLRATIEEFGKVGRNLLKARKIPAPCWIVVTSQEKLDEVVAAISRAGPGWRSITVTSAPALAR